MYVQSKSTFFTYFTMAHMKRALTHEENRCKVCAICFGKAKYNLTAIVLERIQRYFRKDYDPSDNRFPCGICSKCRSDLIDISAGKKKIEILPELYDYIHISPITTTTRSNPVPLCDCEICNVSQKSGCITHRSKGRPRSIERPTSMPIVLCSFCKSEYGKGINHKCTQRNLRDNMLRMINSSDDNTQQAVASSIIRKSSIDNISSLYSGGSHPLKVKVLSNNTKDSSQFNIDDIMKFQNATSSSNNEIRRKFVPFVRSVLGKASVESDIGSKLRDRDNNCLDFFSCTTCEFECTATEDGTSTVSKDLVYCTNITDFVNFVCEKRNYEKASVTFKMGIDSGGGCLKFCLNIMSNSDTNSDSKKLINRTMLDTSVKRLLIVAISYDVKETYFNVRLILNLLKIDEIDFEYVCAVDLKMANILCGLQSHSSSFPCVYCNCPKMEFSDKEKFRSHPMRTIGEIKKYADDYMNVRRMYNEKASAKEFRSCVNHPMIQGSDSEMLIQLIPPPELHLLLRIVNKIFKELQTAVPNIAEEWLNKLGIVQPKHHGGEFTGNMCRKLLKSSHVLIEICNRSNQASLINLFGSTLVAFDNVVDHSFGKQLCPVFENSVKTFENLYLQTGMTVTTAAHIVMVHLIQFCKLKKCGLSRFSEQASEAVHSDFDTMWKSGGKVSQNNENYGTHLLHCVIRYNSRHL